MNLYMTAAILAITASSAAMAQDTAPDGTDAFGIEPYVGVLAGYHNFDRRNPDFPALPAPGRMDGALVGGVAGINLPLGPVFVGVEGNASKGFNDIDWEYGARGRLGLRAGESGMIYASAGRQWINGKRGFANRNDWIYGMGFEVGPKDIGLAGVTGNSGIRLRLQMDTYDGHSLRPMGGVIFHF